MYDIRDEWRDMMEHQRDYGFKVSPLGTLLAAPQKQAQRERETEGGVQYRKGDKKFVLEHE